MLFFLFGSRKDSPLVLLAASVAPTIRAEWIAKNKASDNRSATGLVRLAKVVKRVKSEIAEAVFEADTDILDEGSITDAIVKQLSGYGFFEMLNLVSCEVAAA